MNELELQVLRQIGESTTSPDVFVNTEEGLAQIRDSLNDALQEVAMLTRGKVREAHIPLVANSTYYRLQFAADHFSHVVEAFLNGQNRRLTGTDTLNLDEWSARWPELAGSPTCYAQIGLDVIAVHPRPSSSGDVLTLRCAVIPARYAHGDSVQDVRDEFRWALVNYAVSEYYASRGDSQTAAEHYRLYLDTLGLHVRHLLSADAIRGLGVRTRVGNHTQVPS